MGCDSVTMRRPTGYGAGVEPGTEIERYIIEERLGEGGMAEVYLARHAVLGSRHAVKILRTEFVADERYRSRFLAEGRIAAQVRHPNVVDVTDVVIAPGVAGLVMEYLDGEPLDQWLDQRREPVDLNTLLAIALPVLDGLAEAHAYGVVHRDLKPANIVLCSNRRGRLRPVVLDFGIAKLGEDTRVQHNTALHTKAGTRMGTPAYMSPEQVRETASVDHRTDLFAMGAILYELATGRIAFAHDSEFDTMQAIVAGRYAPLDGVPDDLAAIIRCALALDPDERFANCGELQRALTALGPGEAPTAPAPAPVKPPPPPEPTVRWRGPALLDGDRVHPLRGKEVVCGRAADADLRLDHPTVSEHHCVLRQERGRWGVSDLRSTLGTLVDGHLVVGRALLRPGQRVTVGQVELVFREAE